jgi:putative methionine-R-sulfoxide reductase with GAF domain
MSAISRSDALTEIAEAATSQRRREIRAAAIANTIRRSGDYRWVGIYDVDDEEIAILAWSGVGPPAFPRFARTEGLSGAAAATGQTVVVNDVAGDPRYLEAFGDTRAEIIVPVSSAEEVVRGTIDVESAVPNAFGPDDQLFLEQCAAAALPLWR